MPLKWLSIALAVGFLGVVAAVTVWSARQSAQPAVTVVNATVTSPAPCSAPGAQDGVEYQLGGKTQQGKLDGCGHLKGVQLSVEVPAGASAPPGGPLREAATAKGSSGLGDRLYVVMVLLAAIGGGVYVLLLCGSLAAPRSA